MNGDRKTTLTLSADDVRVALAGLLTLRDELVEGAPLDPRAARSADIATRLIARLRLAARRLGG